MTGTRTEQVSIPEVSIVRTTRRARARRMLSTILHTRRALVGLILVLGMVFVSALAPIVAPYDPVLPDQGPQFASPGRDYLFGTDDFGRDTLSRVIWGGRKALVVAVSAVLLAVVAGGVLGLVAGFVGRKVDQLIMRLMDILQAYSVAGAGAHGRGLPGSGRVEGDRRHSVARDTRIRQAGEEFGPRGA